YLGELYGLPSGDCYKAIIHRNTPLPVRQTEIFYTFNEGQEAVDVRIYQGENVDARRNQLLGRFMVEGLDGRVDAGSPILFDLQLDLDGILEVEVTEKHTGLKKRVVIEDAFHKLSPDELEEARRRVQGSLDASVAGDLGMEEVGAVPDDGAIGCGEVEEDGEDGEDGKEAEAGRPRPPADLAAAERAAWVAATSLLEKAERMLPRLLAADREEVQGLAFQLRQDLEGHDFPAIRLTSSELSDVLFYLE
ncbi:MAG: hypothetical protein FJ125_15320, partial [Deltaproteobacteria bacterium]|nr:hypothetical protein [Deltaproteobacteria bacterium]